LDERHGICFERGFFFTEGKGIGAREELLAYSRTEPGTVAAVGLALFLEFFAAFLFLFRWIHANGTIIEHGVVQWLPHRRILFLFKLILNKDQM
jgi:hypothetical protein